MSTELLPLNHIARRLRVSPIWLKSEAAAGRIPVLDAGGRFLADPDAVRAALMARLPSPSTQNQEGTHAIH